MGRLLLLISTFLLSSSVFARQNIECTYFDVHGTWQASAGFAISSGTDRRLLQGGISLESNTVPGYGICAATTDVDDQDAQATVHLASYLLDDVSESMSTETCEWQSAKAGVLLTESTVLIQPGKYAEIDSDPKDPDGATKILNYIPTDAEIALWQSQSEDDASAAIEQRCLDLVSGSVPINPSSATSALLK